MYYKIKPNHKVIVRVEKRHCETEFSTVKP